jgi:hypothetical protein
MNSRLKGEGGWRAEIKKYLECTEWRNIGKEEL